jgi:hypothetical protein
MSTRRATRSCKECGKPTDARAYCSVHDQHKATSAHIDKFENKPRVAVPMPIDTRAAFLREHGWKQLDRGLWEAPNKFVAKTDAAVRLQRLADQERTT